MVDVSKPISDVMEGIRKIIPQKNNEGTLEKEVVAEEKENVSESLKDIPEASDEFQVAQAEENIGCVPDDHDNTAASDCLQLHINDHALIISPSLTMSIQLEEIVNEAKLNIISLREKRERKMKTFGDDFTT